MLKNWNTYKKFDNNIVLYFISIISNLYVQQFEW